MLYSLLYCKKLLFTNFTILYGVSSYLRKALNLVSLLRMQHTRFPFTNVIVNDTWGKREPR